MYNQAIEINITHMILNIFQWGEEKMCFQSCQNYVDFVKQMYSTNNIDLLPPTVQAHWSKGFQIHLPLQPE